MGAILNNLSFDDTDELETLSPDRADWLTSHADATGLSVIEVERLWTRFKQITCSNNATKLYLNTSPLSNDLANDVFVRNFLHQLPRSKASNNAISFGYFITVMLWLDGANVDKKLSIIYFYINNGQPISAPMISNLLTFLYPTATQNEMKSLSIQFMRQIGASEQDQVNEQQFVAGVKRLIPPEELEQLLNFEIVPGTLVEEANSLPPIEIPIMDLREKTVSSSTDLISDQELQKLANLASRKNWIKLAYTLGFLEYDVEAYLALNSYDSTKTVTELLEIWREQEGLSATKTRLKHWLRESQLDELVFILN